MADVGRSRFLATQQTNVATTWKAAPEFITGSNEVAPVVLRDPTHVPEYSREIFEHFLEVEATQYGDRDYIGSQSDMRPRMRYILFDWLMDVVAEFKYHPETYFLAVDITDRYLCQRSVSRSKLQLVGITALLIAAKHEEIWPPRVKNCVEVTVNTFTADEVIDMERDIATCLNFKFTVPTMYQFACYFLNMSRCSDEVREAVLMFLDSASLCYDMLTHLPSHVAATAMALGRLLVAHNCPSRGAEHTEISLTSVWGADMMVASGNVSVEMLLPIATRLLSFTEEIRGTPGAQRALYCKYVSPEHKRVALLKFPSVQTLARALPQEAPAPFVRSNHRATGV